MPSLVKPLQAMLPHSAQGRLLTAQDTFVQKLD